MNESLGSQAPLTGIKVVDFGHYIAGPLTGMHLADQGAEVIKIEKPGKPDFDSPANAVFNRGKKKLTLDLKSEEGIETAKKLVSSADILIENFRPGVMTRLGLGPDDMTKLNGRLIYLSLPGFYSTDKDKSQVRAFEGIVNAATGLFTDLHTPLRRLLDGPPIFTPLTPGSAYGSVHGAIAAVLALYNREETGIGDVIEVSLAGAAMSAMGAMVLEPEEAPARYRPKRSWMTKNITLPIQKYKLSKLSEEDRQSYWTNVVNVRSPFHDSFQAGDGKWVHFLAAGNSRLSTQLVKALGIYDQLLDSGMVDKRPMDDLSLDNNVSDPPALTREWTSFVRKNVQDALRQKAAHEWTPIMKEYGVPFSVHRSSMDWLNASEAEEAGFVVTVDDEEYGSLSQMGVQTYLSGTPDEILKPKPATHFTGDINDAWDSEVIDPTEVKQGSMVPKRNILEGLRVLDLSTVLAGPTCARTLAEYGADVIKIDPPEPYFLPQTHCFSPMEVSQGKRSIILDLKTEDGHEAFKKLVKTSDIIVHNMSPGTPERLGIPYELLKQYKDDIIVVDLTAFNGPKPGPWGDLKGFDPVLQAATGVSGRYGGEGKKPILHGVASCIDYLTGYSGTLGSVLALFKRKRSGIGDMAKTSLAQGGQLIQAPFMYSSDKYQSGEEVHGQESLGDHPLNHIYKAKDGYLFLSGLEEDVSKLGEVSDFAGLNASSYSTEEILRLLSSVISSRSVSYWEYIFNGVGLACQSVDTVKDMREKYIHRVYSGAAVKDWDDGRSISISRMMDHPLGCSVDNVSPGYARFRNTEVNMGNPMPKLGSHTREVLLDLGYSHAEVDELISKKVASESFHEDYLPS